MSWIDCHAHLDFFGNNSHINEVVDRAVSNKVETIISMADTPQSCRKNVKLAKEFPSVFIALGVHPQEANLYTDEFEEQLYKLSKNKKVIGIGEIGLDYYRDSVPHSVQQEVFRRQLRVAKDLDLPAIIHNREAEDDVLQILDEEEFPAGRTVLHCFSGSKNFAKRVLAKGFYISLSGAITYNRPEHTDDILIDISEDRLLTETDSPFLAPVPHRGKTNEPSYLPIVGKHLAKLRGCDSRRFSKTVRQNAGNIFGI